MNKLPYNKRTLWNPNVNQLIDQVAAEKVGAFMVPPALRGQPMPKVTEPSVIPKHKITIWVRAWVAGYKGLNYVHVPPQPFGCSLTDERGPSPDPNAKSRVALSVTADFSVWPPTVLGSCRTDPGVHAVGCGPGSPYSVAPMTQLKCRAILAEYGPNGTVAIDVHVDAVDTTWPDPPAMRAQFIGRILVSMNQSPAAIWLAAYVPAFPEFEAYVAVDNGQPAPLFVQSPGFSVSNSPAVLAAGAKSANALAKTMSIQSHVRLMPSGASGFTMLAPQYDGLNLLAQMHLPAQLPGTLSIIRFWVNAFIPGYIPGYTRVLTEGPFKGKSAIPGPSPQADCFLTDNRMSSNVLSVPSRLSSSFTLVFDGMGGYKLTQKHDVGQTHEIDCEDGEIECAKKAENANMYFGSPYFPASNQSGNVLAVDVKMAAGNPCSFAAENMGIADIKILGTVYVNLQKWSVDFDAKITPFPAIEAYASINGSYGARLFLNFPPPGATVMSLIGGAVVYRRGRVTDSKKVGEFDVHEAIW